MPTMPLPVALMLKLGVWALAWSAFLALLATRLAPVDARVRRLLGAALVGAFAGSKLLHGIAFVAPTDADPVDTLLWWYAGDSAAGAVLGARLALWLAERESGARREADALVVPTGVALMVLAAGSVFWALRGGNAGGATDLPWGMDFGDGLARHPLMLYQVVVLVVLLGLMRGVAAHSAGMRSGLFLVAYSAYTIFANALSPPFAGAGLADLMLPRVRLVAGLMTVEQFVCLIALGVMLPRVIRHRRRTGH